MKETITSFKTLYGKPVGIRVYIHVKCGFRLSMWPDGENQNFVQNFVWDTRWNTCLYSCKMWIQTDSACGQMEKTRTSFKTLYGIPVGIRVYIRVKCGLRKTQHVARWRKPELQFKTLYGKRVYIHVTP